MVTLHEHRTAKAFTQRGSDDDRDVLAGALLRVRNLRAGDLEDERACLERVGSAEYRAHRVVRRRADVHRGNRVPACLPGTTCQVEIVNRGRMHADMLPDFPEQPAGVLLLLGTAEDRGVDHRIHALGRQQFGMRDGHGRSRDGDAV